MKLTLHPTPHVTQTNELRRCIFSCSAVLLVVCLLWTAPVPTLIALRLTALCTFFVSATSLAVAARAILMRK
jgi:hypothetical protein